MRLRLYSILLTLLMLIPVATQAADTCIRETRDTMDCDVMRMADGTIILYLENDLSVSISLRNYENTILVKKADGTVIETILAGLVDVPLGTPQHKLTEPRKVESALTYRLDGVFEIHTQQGSVFFIPLNGGLLFIPDRSATKVLWLPGDEIFVSPANISDISQRRIQAALKYLKISSSQIQTNYRMPNSQARAQADFGNETPECCCNGRGLKTAVIGVGGCGDVNCASLSQKFNSLSERERECLEFIPFPYDPKDCPKDIAKKLAAKHREMSKMTQGDNAKYCNTIEVAAHSQGGIIAGYAAANMPGANVHSFGSPLQGTQVLGAVNMGTMWVIGYIIPPGGSLVADLVTDCMTEAAASTHSYPPVSGTSTNFTTHTAEPSNTFTTATQQGGPTGSRTKHHPGTDHGSVATAGLRDIAEKHACTECGNQKVEQPTEECDPSGSSCTTAGNEPGKCSKKCKCEALCGNGVVDPGEECDSPLGPGADCTLPTGKTGICGGNCLCHGCGDGRVDAPEQCDPPGSYNADICGTFTIPTSDGGCAMGVNPCDDNCLCKPPPTSSCVVVQVPSRTPTPEPTASNTPTPEPTLSTTQSLELD